MGRRLEDTRGVLRLANNEKAVDGNGASAPTSAPTASAIESGTKSKRSRARIYFPKLLFIACIFVSGCVVGTYFGGTRGAEGRGQISTAIDDG